MPPTTSKTATRAEDPGPKFKSLLDALKAVQPLANEVVDAAENRKALSRAEANLRDATRAHVTETTNLNKVHTEAIAAADKKISDLQNAHGLALRSFSETNQHLREDMRASKENSEAQRDAERRELTQETRKLRDKLASTEWGLDEKSRELEDSETQLLGLKEKLKATEHQLEMFNLTVGWEYKVASNSKVQPIQQLCNELHALGRKMSAEPFSQGTDTDRLYQKVSSTQLPRFIGRQIPISNSVTSQRFRAAVAEAVIAHQMVKKVFHSVEPTSVPIGSSLKELLRRLLQSERCREAMFRSLLIIALKPEIDANIQSAVRQATEETLTLLGPLIEATSITGTIKQELERFFGRAAEVWRQTINSRLKVTAYLQDECVEQFYGYEDNDFRELVAGSSDGVAAANASSITLFPRILGNNIQSPLHPGMVLHAEQYVCTQAWDEASIQRLRVQPPESANRLGAQRDRHISRLTGGDLSGGR